MNVGLITAKDWNGKYDDGSFALFTLNDTQESGLKL